MLAGGPDNLGFLGRQEYGQFRYVITRDDNVVDDMVFEELRGISDLLLFLGHSDLALASFDGELRKSYALT